MEKSVGIIRLLEAAWLLGLVVWFIFGLIKIFIGRD